MADNIRADLKAAEDSERDVQGEKPSEKVSHWLREIDAADRHEKDWRERAEKIVNLYKDERKAAEDDSAQRRFNILYANTEVLKGAMYQRCPVPDIRRRWLERDPVGRLAAMILTRCVTTAIDRGDLDGVMRDCVQDMVLPGRGLAKARYKPTYDTFENRVPVDAPADGVVMPKDVQQDDQGYFRMEPVEEVVYECVEIDYIEWDMVRFSPAKRFKKLRWIAFGELLTRDDLIREFGEDIGKKVSLKWAPRGVEDNDQNAIFKRALVWTIWNRTEKKVVAVCDGYKEAPLKEVDDPLRLEEFFPAPQPLYAICTTDSMVPTPEYAVYQDHARDLDALEERISVLQEALRRRGVFDASIPELEGLAKTGDNKFVGIKDWARFAEKGGLTSALEEMDLAPLAKVLTDLMALAEAKKQQIYEIIGIADIMRGSTKADETLGAQQLKSQYGSMRSGPRQTEVQRFARDLIRIISEIIAEHFSPKTMQEMSGIQLALNDAEKQQIAAVTPDDPRAKRPTWEEVLKVLRSDKLRSFKVGIETDSTIKPQADEEQKNRVELLTSLTGYLQQALPAVQAGMIPKKVASELMMFGVRAFPAGSQLEELLDEWASGGIDEMLAGPQAQQQQPSPEQQKAEMDLKTATEENAVKREEIGFKREELNFKRQQLQAEQADAPARRAAETEQRNQEMEVRKGETEAKRHEIAKRTQEATANKDAEIAKTVGALRKELGIDDGLAAVAQSLEQLVGAIGELMKRQAQTMAMTKHIADAAYAEREVVRDPKTGRALRSRVVKPNGSGGAVRVQ